METAINRLKEIGIQVPDILLPKKDTDLTKWATVACDQYTSERAYWQSVEDLVKQVPSTYHITFPEVYLEDPHMDERIDRINAQMKQYVDTGLFDTYPQSFFLVHRETGSGCGRWGLIVALDLEQYDYSADSRSLIRATEGTIISRIPPRKRIRKDAPLELPHILVLISDAHRTVIEPLIALRDSLECVYDTDLMKQGGHVKAYRIHAEEHLLHIAQAFEILKGSLDPHNPLLFAMGDGNHSLATAKSCWEDTKVHLSKEERESHPARYALVELENIFDEGLEFEAIHRVLFSIERETFLGELACHCTSYAIEEAASIDEVIQSIEEHGGLQRFGYCDSDGVKVISLTEPKASLAAGTLQLVIDSLLQKEQGVQVDYIHGIDVTHSLGKKQGNIGLFLPSIAKESFFDSIISDGALPRKTFSMGQAHEKRFYMECRKIT